MNRYLDISTILSEEERVPCIFQSEAKNLAFLDPTIVNEPNLPKHSRIELPLWLGTSLSSKGIVNIEIPKHFGPMMRNELYADAKHVNLREFSYHFLQAGLKLCNVTKDDDLYRCLRVAFTGSRYNDILVRCFNGGHSDSAEFNQKLCSSEIRLYNAGVSTTDALHNWKTRKAFIVQGSSLLTKRTTSSQDNDSNKKRLI